MTIQQISNLIVFNQSKDEEFTLISGFRQLHKHIRNSWQVEIHRNAELSETTFEKCRIFVLPCPRTKFTEEEFASIRKFLQKGGGSLLVLCSEGGEEKNGTNINFLLEEFGIAFNSDSVIRTVFYKYFDPKEALISNGILNRAFPSIAGVQKSLKLNNSTNIGDTDIRGLGSAGGEQRRRTFGAEGFATILHSADGDDEEDVENNFSSSLSFIYPFGCTLSVNRSSTCILSTGTVCFPIACPICALHQIPKENGNGRLVAIGSVQMFTDDYFNKEDNAKIFDAILKFLSDGIELNQIDAAEPEISDAHPIPDNVQLSNQLKLCLQESELEQTFFGDFTKHFEQSLCSITLDHWPEAIRIYEKIGLKYEPLTLVTPAFQVPMPPFQPAVFPPQFRELPPPQLELFDLDDAFAIHEVQLAQLTNRCAENELDLYIREAGEILGINRLLSANLSSFAGSDQKITAKRIVEYVTRHLIEWKKSTAEMEESDDILPHIYLPDESGTRSSFGGMTGNWKETAQNADGKKAAKKDEEEEGAFSDIDQYDDLN